MTTTSYMGNGAYCYSNSLYMSLLSAEADRTWLPLPGFLECLTTMPFGNMYLALEQGPLPFFSGPNIDPDRGLSRALATLGWTCEKHSGGSAEEALAALREAAQKAPVQVGPIDMGYLTYHPVHQYQKGADHFAVVLAVEDTSVLFHDPQGYPYATLSHKEFLQSWKAEDISYVQEAYTFRTDFRAVETPRSREEMIERTLPMIRENLLAAPDDPIVRGGVEVFSLLARDLRNRVSRNLASHLLRFALPLAARRCQDAAVFLESYQQAATILEKQARLFGRAQYEGARKRWTQVAESIEQIGMLEQQLIEVMAYEPAH